MCKKTRIRLIALAACVALAIVWAIVAVPNSALAKKPTETSIPVIVTFDDLPDDGVQSDDGTAYPSSGGKFSCYISAGTGMNIGNGNLSPRASRTFFLDLSRVISLSGDCAPPMLPTERFGAMSDTKGYPDSVFLQVALGENVSNMAVGEEKYVAETRLKFSLDGLTWRLLWGDGPFVSGVGEWCDDGPKVKVVRVSLDEWRVETTTNDDGKAEAWLWLDDPNHPPIGPIFCGKFDVAFGFTAVRDQ